jgi:hypothetical protein
VHLGLIGLKRCSSFFDRTMNEVGRDHAEHRADAGSDWDITEGRLRSGTDVPGVSCGRARERADRRAELDLFVHRRA